MTLTLSYEAQRDLLTGMVYKRSNTQVTARSYAYDALGRPLTRGNSKDGSTVNDSFGYNTRSELTSATVNNGAYAYDYDNIGNRAAAVEDSSGVASRTEYTANALNQYTAIGDFEPTYDDAGNQTLVKTSTGIWAVTYNAENRPMRFTNAESATVVECTYDYMGRRATKKVTVNGAVTLHHRYLYRGYLQIACCDLTRGAHPCLWLICWDPTQPTATRPLAIQKDGTWYTYGWDLTKNICEVFGQHGYIRTNYTYAPFGQVTISGDVTQPIQWSSEYHDTELALVYYNYRHYNPLDGRWLGRDRIHNIKHIYAFAINSPFKYIDILGNVFTGVDTIPDIMEYNGFYEGAYLMRHWFNSTGETLYKELNELLKVKRVKEMYDDLIANVTNEAAKVTIKRKAKHKLHDEFLYDGEIFPEIVKKEQSQYRLIKSSLFHAIDDFYTAYGDATLYSMVNGRICHYANGRKYLNIIEIHIIFHDKYTFEDNEDDWSSQTLGFFDTSSNYMGKNFVYGRLVKNIDFRQYYMRTGIGKDFEIFSDVRTINYKETIQIL